MEKERGPPTSGSGKVLSSPGRKGKLHSQSYSLDQVLSILDISLQDLPQILQLSHCRTRVALVIHTHF